MLEDGSALSKLQPQIGSNAYAFGKEATENGRGLVYGNPHFPWDGSERLYQTHLKIPGKVDVAGGSLYGVPLVLIGHTRGLAWSHTVATAWRFTPYKLTLGPDPHTYVVDGETKDMEETEVTVKALSRTARSTDVTRSIYSTEYGPMLTSLVGIPLPWGAGNGFALADVNATNFRYLNHFLANNRAQTVAQVRPDPAPLPGHPVGELDRGRLDRRGLLLDAGRDPLRGRRASRPSATSARPAFEILGPADPRRLALGLQLGRAPTTRPRPAPSRPTRSRPSSATTTSTTATTPTGSRTPRSRSPVTTGSSGSRRPSARTARGSACSRSRSA